MPLKIAISGASGLVGSVAVRYFESLGHTIVRITRGGSTSAGGESAVVMDVKNNGMDSKGLDGIDVVIHLAGANIAGKRWTDDYKSQILLSRVETTRILANALPKLAHPPKIFLCASAIGYYGNTDPDSGITFEEPSPLGKGFLADVCHQWEAATQPAKEHGIRVVNMRIGAVLSREGGALQKMWIPFQLGLGGPLGHGRQMFSWVALDEIPRIMEFLINNDSIMGPVNVTAPHPVTNAEFTKAFGKAIKRPTIFPVPAFGARVLFGEMADALLLEGSTVIPKKLLEAGYKFHYPEIDAGLAASLKS
ncbi:MAG: TIGR01777 family oxidoreductase [Candidatus Omnitrophica bacterium]|nr:TIGR01777 family oxidoreductase [Candidatus Omnitrophota bacterium]